VQSFGTNTPWGGPAGRSKWLRSVLPASDEASHITGAGKR
jgi:hypothetical protein